MSENQPLPRSTRAIYGSFDFFQKHGMTRILPITVMLVIFGILASGIYIVKKEEEGVLTRFGRVVQTEIGPGIHYYIPFIDQVHIRKIRRINRMQIVSNDAGKVNFTILSGDTNMLEIDVALQYRIDHLKNHLFAASDPISLITMITREELVGIIGSNFIDLIFTSNRNLIERHLFNEVARQIEPFRIGVEIIALKIVDVRPIEETLDAFRDVSDAIAERMQRINDANRAKERSISHSKGQAEALVLSAQAKAEGRLLQAKSNADMFTALLEEYQKQPDQVAITRYWQRMRTILSEASLAAVNPGNESTIDINMIDSLAGFTPAQVLRGAPPAATADEALDRPLLSTMLTEPLHTLEKTGQDKHLLEGQFHTPGVERDHFNLATPRSLIFDTPSVLSHDHLTRQSNIAKQRDNEKPMVEVLASGGAEHGTTSPPASVETTEETNATAEDQHDASKE